ncbi:response regulator [uncultured Desulfobacter sp.]|uniref:hybrid sensor histidine kinase/response regulator n=1 Tax=uncultured Desulfobacter sp. TaxID=240139 RepID=UPI002AAB426A|nr:response regulator [uncultured Desulfobacter sp.]
MPESGNNVTDKAAELEQTCSILSDFNSRLHSLVETVGGLHLCSDMVRFPGLLLEKFAMLMDADGGSFYMSTRTGLRLMASLDPGHAAVTLPSPLFSHSILNHVVTTQTPLLIRNITRENQFISSSWGGYKDNSLIIFPILDSLDGTKVEAVVSLHNKKTPPFTAQDKEVGTILASYSKECLRAVRAFDALQQSEYRYRTLFERSNDAIFIVDKKNGQYRDCNRAAEKLTGRSTKEIRKLTRNDLTGLEKEVGDPMRTSGPAQSMIPPETIVYIRPDKSRCPAKVNVVPLDDHQVIEIARDISQDLEMERQLQHSRKMEAIGTLAGGIAHDFNNILSGILGYAQLLEMQIDDTQAVRKNLAHVIKGATRAGDLVQQILTFSRQVEHEHKALKLYLIVRESVKFLRSSIPTSIEISETISSQSQVMVDATQIHQVIINLCTNAYHAIGNHNQGRITVSLQDFYLDETRVRQGCSPGNYVRLRVTDTGKGIEQETMDRIFDPYFTTKEMSRGTGLGLAVVEGVIKKHGGFIVVTSQVGRGTKFNIFLPIAEPSHSGNTVQPIPRGIFRGTGRILLAEDEVLILQATQRILRTLGYQVTAFIDGKAAMEAFEHSPDRYDIVITDMGMPRMNGRDLAKGILALRPDMPIILCTGFHESYTREAALQEGIRRYVQKPVTGRELAEMVQEEIFGKIEF